MSGPKHFSVANCCLAALLLLVTCWMAGQPLYAQSAKKNITIVIDPGHGGRDPGRISRTKGMRDEKHLNLLIAKKLEAHIEKNLPNVRIVHTRTTDVYVSLERRVEIANNSKADYFISIHCDSNPNKTINGTKLHVYKHSYNTSRMLAEHIREEFRDRAKRKDRGIMSAHDRGYNLYVLQFTNMPGVLIECGFLTNPYEEKFLNSNYGQEIIASAIFRALRTFVNKEHPTEDHQVAYKVQIMASKTKLGTDLATFKKTGMKVEEYLTEAGEEFRYKYLVGHETDREKALELRKKMIELGFKGAFLVQFNQ